MAKFEYMQRAFSSELKPRARLVLQVLVLHCNKEGECFPSIKTIAAKCGYGVSTVKRALDELVKAGYIVKQARFDERKNGGQTSNLYTLCSDLPCPDEPESVPVPEDDASDESPAVQPESASADACNTPDPTPGEQSATLPTADSYSFADGFETKNRAAELPPDSYVDWGAVHFYTPLNRTGEQILTDEDKSEGLFCFGYADDATDPVKLEQSSTGKVKTGNKLVVQAFLIE